MPTMKDTADVRAKLLEIWKLVDEKAISTTEARLHIGLARAVLETLKVEIAAAHLSRSDIPAIPIAPGTRALPLSKRTM